MIRSFQQSSENVPNQEVCCHYCFWDLVWLHFQSSFCKYSNDHVEQLCEEEYFHLGPLNFYRLRFQAEFCKFLVAHLVQPIEGESIQNCLGNFCQLHLQVISYKFLNVPFEQQSELVWHLHFPLDFCQHCFQVRFCIPQNVLYQGHLKIWTEH